MSVIEILIIILGVFVFFAIIHKIDRHKKPLRRACVSVISGVLSLLAVNISGVFTGVTLPVSTLTLLTSLVGGVPGVTMLLALNLFF